VPVYTSNEDYEQGGAAPEDEKKAYVRIYHEALRRRFSAGSVCVYIVAPDGRVMDSKTVPDTPKVLSMLKSAIDELGLKEGKTLVEPRPQSARPSAPPDALVLHLSAPYEVRTGSWQDFPAESWLVFPRAEWAKMLPSSAGDAWAFDHDATLRLLNYFYPATEDTRGEQIDRNRVETAVLRGRIESVRDGRVRARIEGTLKMKRPFYPNHPEHEPVPIDATIVGFMEFAPDGSAPPTVRLVTERATFGRQSFGVAARSVP
jgi:hypothetical protein